MHPPPPTAAAPARPASIADLFMSFTLLALQGFGGVLAIAQRELVEKKRWLTNEEFVEDWAVAQIMPGPNVVNLSIMLGDRYFGWRGAAAALAGMLTVPLLVVLALALAYSQMAAHPAVAAGLIVATGLKLVPALKSNPLGAVPCALLGAACFVAIAWLRWPLLPVLLVLGSLASGLAYHRLAPKEEEEKEEDAQ